MIKKEKKEIVLAFRASKTTHDNIIRLSGAENKKPSALIREMIEALIKKKAA